MREDNFILPDSKGFLMVPLRTRVHLVNERLPFRCRQRKCYSSESKPTSSKERLLVWYQNQLDIRPLFTKCVTSGFIAGSGDIICQYLTFTRNKYQRGNNEMKNFFDDIDIKRTLRFSFLGTFLIGGVLHYWYGFLNKFIVGNGFVPVIKRIFLDQAFMAPSFIAIFMSSLFGLEQGYNANTDLLQKKLKKDWWETVRANWFVWIPAQAINFGFIRPHYQVLFSNIIGLNWNTYLSFKATGDRKRR